MYWKRFFPVLEWLPQYRRKDLSGDFSAGLTVGVMLIPQGMAYALLAGLPPIYGLYAATIPVMLYVLLGTSRQLSVGPTATSSLLTAAAIQSLALTGDEMSINIAIMLAFMVGVIQLALGLLRMGFLVNFLSNPVVSGFTSASALIIGFSQFKHLLGVSAPNTNYVHEIVIALAKNVGNINWITVCIGLVGIILVRYTKKITEKIPGALVAVAIGILVVWGLGLQQQGVAIVGTIPDGLPQIGMFYWNWEQAKLLFPFALSISLVGFVESIAIAKAIQNKHRSYQVLPNQELVALGVSKIGGAFFQSFATTGGFSRTAVNDRAGAKTNLAGMLSATLILLTLLFLTPLFYYLPQAILASVILAAIFSLVEVKEARRLWQTDRRDFVMWLITFVATLTVGIQEGILLGASVSIAAIIYRTVNPHIAVLGRIGNTLHYRNVRRFDNLEQRPDVLVIRIDADLYFANSQSIKESVEALINSKGEALRLLVFCAESISGIDSTAAQMLEDLHKKCHTKGITFYWSAVKGPVRDKLFSSGFIAQIGEENMFLGIQDAIDAFDKTTENVHRQYATQHGK